MYKVTNVFFSLDFDARGGRNSAHLSDLVETAKMYTDVILIVGNNDIGSQTDWQTVQNFRTFVASVKPVRVRICGFLPRRDHEKYFNPHLGRLENPATRINRQLALNFPREYQSPRGDFRESDFGFGYYDLAHVNFFGKRHMCRFIHRQCRSIYS